MKQYKYSFAKRMKIVCPQCGKKTFVPYVDNATGQVLNSGVGKCDRANQPSRSAYVLKDPNDLKDLNKMLWWGGIVAADAA